MLYKTRGIVINHIKYSETSIIAKIFTEEFGLTSYIINGVRSKRAKNKIALFQPLTLLDLVVYHKKNANLNRISELKCSEPFTTLPLNIKKSSIALFVTEVLSKTLKGEEKDYSLFDFLYQSILILEHTETNYENFHLHFIVKLSRYLGFGPRSAYDILDQINQRPEIIRGGKNIYQLLDDLIISKYEDSLQINNLVRRELLKTIIDFYRLHVESLGEIKSVTILQEVLS